MNLSWSKINTPPSHTPFGLDISDFALRAVQLKKDRGRNFSLRCIHEIEVPAGIINKGEIVDKEKLSILIKKLISSHSNNPFSQKIASREVITALPETKTFIKMVTFKWPEEEIETEENNKKNKKSRSLVDETLKKILAKELSEDIPLSLEESTYDYHVLKGNLKKVQPGDNIQLLTAVAPKNISNDYTEVLENSGLIPVALEVEGLAIARSIIKQDVSQTEENTTKIMVDLGGNRTGLIIYHNGIIRYSLSVPVSGRSITQAIADKEKISFNEAEKLKITHELDLNIKSDIDEVISSALENIIERIKEALLFCELKLPERTKPQVLLCGGGANWPGLKKIINQKLNVPVEVAYPWVNFPKPPANFPPDKALTLTTAIGLGLGGLYDYS